MEFELSKIDAAVEQLDWAIRLFLDHQAYLPAITLAGAAEEILGQAVGDRAAFAQLMTTFGGRLDISEKIISLRTTPLLSCHSLLQQSTYRSHMKLRLGFRHY
jgi:hypothetical protein